MTDFSINHPAFRDPNSALKVEIGRALGKEAESYELQTHTQSMMPTIEDETKNETQLLRAGEAEGLSPFLTEAEQTAWMETCSGIPSLKSQPEKDAFLPKKQEFSKSQPKVYGAITPKSAKESDVRSVGGVTFKLMTNNEAVASATQALHGLSDEPVCFDKVGEGAVAIHPQKQEEARKTSFYHKYDTALPTEPKKEFAERTPKTVKEWSKYLFDKMAFGDIELSVEHTEGLKKFAYDNLKLIHMGHQASIESTKSLLNMYDFAKIPNHVDSSKSRKTEIPQKDLKMKDMIRQQLEEQKARLTAQKEKLGAEILEKFKKGVLAALGLAKHV